MKPLACILLIILISFSSLPVFAYTEEECVACHATGTGESQKKLDLTAFKSSVHPRNNLGCQDCHTRVLDKTHETEQGQDPVDCSQCHEQENLHGGGSQQDLQPQCHDCHTRHNIRPKTDETSSIHSGNLKDTCGRCHPKESGQIDALSFLPSIKISTHEKQDFSLACQKDNCIGCHQGQAVHGQEEPINDQNCRVCHFDSNGKSALLGVIHLHTDSDRQPEVFTASLIHLVFLGVIVILGLGVYVKKTTDPRR
jgi:hypothetical protein